MANFLHNFEHSFGHRVTSTLFGSHHHHHGHHTINNPGCPWEGEIPNGLQPGKEIHIQGHVPHHANRFEFNLKTNSGTALHINPRFDQNAIVRNSEQYGAWANEERSGYLSFHRGSNFQLVIRADHDKYHVTINGTHAFDFHHRVPVHEVHRLSILGDVQIHSITFTGGAGHGGEQHGPLNVPGAVPLRQGCHPGRMIQIRGLVPHHAGRFQINLQSTGMVEPNDIALHFSVRWNDPNSGGQPVVIRTNRQYGAWGNEERHASHFPFSRGMPFDMLVLVEPHEFKVAVNGQHFVSFAHRSPIETVNHVGVTGDVQIQSINVY
jgi:hypothetical protein